MFDLKIIQTRGDKKYFITFINYYAGYCYVYLLRTKTRSYKCSNILKVRLKINLAKNQSNKK